jgi:hypothetical protein
MHRMRTMAGLHPNRLRFAALLLVIALGCAQSAQAGSDIPG